MPTRRAALLLTSAALFWGGNFVIGRAVAESIPPVSLTFYRWLLASAVLAILTGGSVWRERSALWGRRWWILMMAVTGVVLFHLFVYAGLARTTAVNATLMVATTPVITPIVAWLWKRERLAVRQFWGILLTLAGTVIVLIRGEIGRLAELAISVGDLLIVAAVIVWAVYSVALRDRPKQVGPVTVLAAVSWTGTVVLLPVYGWEFAAGGGFPVTAGNLLAIAYVAVFASVLAYLAWNRGVVEIGAIRAGPFMNLMPVFGALLAVTFLGEVVEWFHLAGVVAIGSGLWLSTKAPEAPASPPADLNPSSGLP